MKKIVTAPIIKRAFLLLSVFLFSELVHTYSGGPPAGYTGAPGEGNCTSCHAGTAITSGTTWNDITLTRTGGLSTVTPNASNTLTLNLSSTTSTDFGFQLCVLPGSATSTSTSLGSFSVGSNSDIQTTSSSSPARTYLMQTSSGVSASSGSKSYTFNWQTPASFSGGATFYLAFNAADGNSSSSGDNIYIKTFSVSVLPVRWVDFSYTIAEDKLRLNWSTATEINNAKFIVERSSNAEDFEEIAELKGKGNSETVSYYSFNENFVPESKTFYRIKQVDFDGKYEYSKLISFDPSSFRLEDIQISVSGKRIRFSQPQQVKNANLIGLDGKPVHSFKNVQEAELNIDFLAPGVYVLVVETMNSEIRYKKIWVQ